MTATAVEPSEFLACRPGYTQLHLGALREVRVSIQSAPLATVLSIVVDALGGPRQGVPPEWAQLVRRAVPAEVLGALAPMFDPAATVMPDCLTPIGDGELSMADQLERIAETPPETLWQSVLDMTDQPPPQWWRLVMRRPRRVLRDYATVMTAGWQAYRPVWQRTAGLRARETERVGAAVVSGALDVILAGISERTRFSGQTLYLPDRAPYCSELGGRRLVLVSLGSGSGASVFNLDSPDLAWLGYPLPGLRRHARREDDETARDPLAALLGPIRSSLLRLLRQPATMGALARRINTAPSTATYHCAQLAYAGLVVRERDGREVRVTRTSRGDAVVELLS